MRPRHIAPIALVLVLTVAGFFIARAAAEHGARRDAERRVEVATAQIGGRVAQAVSLTESLRRFMEDAGGIGVTESQTVGTEHPREPERVACCLGSLDEAIRGIHRLPTGTGH